MTLYVIVCFGFDPDIILYPFSISTPVGISNISKNIYSGYVVSVGSKQTLVDLFELDMVDFNIILGIDWLDSCYASLDCLINKVILRFPSEPIIEWEGCSLAARGRFIYYLRARRLISKRCFYHLFWVKDSNSEGPSYIRFR